MRAGMLGGLALAMAACSANYVEDSQASVILVVTAINEGAPITSDVRSETDDGGSTIVNCNADVSVILLPKNPGAVGIGPSEAVVISRYEVTYARTDSRGAEGVDVPFRIVGPVSLTVPPNGTATFPITIVRHQAKFEPPLVNIDGASLMTMAAQITLYGETISREGVTASGSVQVTFGDFAEGSETCETE